MEVFTSLKYQLLVSENSQRFEIIDVFSQLRSLCFDW